MPQYGQQRKHRNERLETECSYAARRKPARVNCANVESSSKGVLLAPLPARTAASRQIATATSAELIQKKPRRRCRVLATPAAWAMSEEVR